MPPNEQLPDQPAKEKTPAEILREEQRECAARASRVLSALVVSMQRESEPFSATPFSFFDHPSYGKHEGQTVYSVSYLPPGAHQHALISVFQDRENPDNFVLGGVEKFGKEEDLIHLFNILKEGFQKENLTFVYQHFFDREEKKD